MVLPACEYHGSAGMYKISQSADVICVIWCSLQAASQGFSQAPTNISANKLGPSSRARIAPKEMLLAVCEASALGQHHGPSSLPEYRSRRSFRIAATRSQVDMYF
ncbi:hypothetical protein DICSQDRAFT_171100 [Dichomitus squalens LYAD-421 SS1]|uniref:Uncharacterized protein n=2 Tax=Dichomitus squalens TaxID=114155 RepID=R7SXC4_DICSQ